MQQCIIKIIPLFYFCFQVLLAQPSQNFGIVIHGGAGYATPESMKGVETEYLKVMQTAIDTGYAILEKGGSAVNAVEAAIKIMEDSPLFNAGKGSVFTNIGTIEMDASIMDGSGLKAGAVANIRRIKNPISAAKMVMDKTPHVLIIGKGAENLWVAQGNNLTDTSYFYDKERFEQWQKSKQSEKDKINSKKHGTVGAAALDKNGNLAAGTSTGGMMNKMPGRVGDSPIIGAGTYANNQTCAVSCTGHGEFFIKHAVAYNINALMMYKNLSLETAATQVIQKELKEVGGTGGIIAIDKTGNISMEFNTPSMFRGYKLSNGKNEVLIFKK